MQKIIEFEDKVALNENSSIPEINKITDNNINEIKSIVNGSLQGTNAMGSIVVDDVKCKNMYGLVITGIIMNNSGVETANSDWQSTPYIEVNSSTDYYYSYSTNNPQSVMGLVTEYDSSKTFIKQTVINDSKHSIETASNTKYVRLSNRVDIDMTNIQFELGSTPTTYTPYKAFENEDIYSTNEIVVGTWIDGKPIYRKAFEKTDLTTGENTFSIGISNVQSVINLQCNVYRSNGYWHPLTFANSSNLNVVMSVVYLEGNISINIGSGITNASKCVGYIEYTKTADIVTRSIEMEKENNDNR